MSDAQHAHFQTNGNSLQMAVRQVQMTVPAGNYRIRVTATNAVGTSGNSALSNAVAAR